MKVNEIFSSIEGEGIRMGLPSVFIRLQNCNLNCIYCDSQYACKGDDYIELSLDEIKDKLVSYYCPRVTVTGGEPLLSHDGLSLIAELSQTYEVNIETNGSIDLQPLYDNCNKSIIVTMDWKSISSGMSNFMISDNLSLLRNQDVLKFVVGCEEDLNQMKDILFKYHPSCNIFVSPIFGKIEASDIVEYVLEKNLYDVRVQLQLHKLIWDPNKRGV